MKYPVRCECGKDHAVSATDAGMSFPCGCGRRVEVPPLHELRAAIGEEMLPAAVLVQTLLLAKKLPGTRECAVCFAQTDGLVQVSVECEVGRVTGQAPSRGEAATGCFIGLLFGGLVGLFTGGYLGTRQSGPLKQVGQDVGFTVPLPVCEACQPSLNDPAALRVALRHIPEYAALLDQYPQARITQMG